MVLKRENITPFITLFGCLFDINFCLTCFNLCNHSLVLIKLEIKISL